MDNLKHPPHSPMQALFDLIQGLAKEEKRLYHLHGRDGRFREIYKAYVQADSYDKSLDREIFQQHFSSFSKAFYSMQKNALMDDILAVLLEYSNSSREDFNSIRLHAKHAVLKYKGFADPALSYLKPALESAQRAGKPRQVLRLLEDYRDTVANSPHSDWDEYQALLSEIEIAKQEADRYLPLELAEQRLSVLISTAERSGGNTDFAEQAWEAVEKIKSCADNIGTEESLCTALGAELKCSRQFENELQRHKRLIALEKTAQKEPGLRNYKLNVIVELFRSCMQCGDFLLINGLIYKCNKEVGHLDPQQKIDFLPRYLELCSLYHYYENELPTAQKEISELIGMPVHTEENSARLNGIRVAYWIASNMPRNATEAIVHLMDQFPEAKINLETRLMELMIAVEANRRDDALVLLQKMRILLRKMPDGRRMGHYRNYLDLLQRHLTKKKVTWQEIHGMNCGWETPLKPNLWLKAKIENKFYYNYVLDDWQGRKKILNF